MVHAALLLRECGAALHRRRRLSGRHLHRDAASRSGSRSTSRSGSPNSSRRIGRSATAATTIPFALPCNFDPHNYDCDAAGLDPGPRAAGELDPVRRASCAASRSIIGRADQRQSPQGRGDDHLERWRCVEVQRRRPARRAVHQQRRQYPLSRRRDDRECPSGAEYEGCGERLILDHFAEGADSLSVRPDLRRSNTELTLVPCRADFEHQLPTRVTRAVPRLQRVRAAVFDGTSVNCWGNFFLGDIGSDLQHR